MISALAGRFFATEPSGKPQPHFSVTVVVVFSSHFLLEVVFP